MVNHVSDRRGSQFFTQRLDLFKTILEANSHEIVCQLALLPFVKGYSAVNLKSSPTIVIAPEAYNNKVTFKSCTTRLNQQSKKTRDLDVLHLLLLPWYPTSFIAEDSLLHTYENSNSWEFQIFESPCWCTDKRQRPCGTSDIWVTSAVQWVCVLPSFLPKPSSSARNSCISLHPSCPSLTAQFSAENISLQLWFRFCTHSSAPLWPVLGLVPVDVKSPVSMARPGD